MLYISASNIFIQISKLWNLYFIIVLYIKFCQQMF
jgi:hypothetical protein